jgi:hypothetical protein
MVSVEIRGATFTVPEELMEVQQRKSGDVGGACRSPTAKYYRIITGKTARGHLKKTVAIPKIGVIFLALPWSRDYGNMH